MTYALPQGTGLGSYTGFDELDNPLTKKIIEKGGATDEQSLKEYGQVAGSMGGAAACAAFGVTAPMAASCGILGGILGGMIASAVPIAKGADLSDAIIDTWNKYSRPQALAAQKAMLAVRTYLTMRDKLISDMVAAAPGQMSYSLADAFLAKQQLPPAPILPRWSPDPIRASTGPEFEALVVPVSPSKYYVDALGHGGYISPLYEARQAQKLLGIDPKVYLLMTYGGAPPIASMNDPIDWGLVGNDEFLFGSGVTTGCRLPWATTLGMKNWGKQAPVRACPTLRPSELAAKLTKDVEKVRLMVKLKPMNLVITPLAPAPASSPLVKGAVTVGVLGLAWWVLKRFL